MRRFLYGLILVLLLPAQAQAGDLFRRDIDMSSVRPTGMVMSVEETRRDARTSEVKVIFKSGSSVGSSFFLISCFCDMARERGAAYFIKLKEWSGKGRGYMYVIGFSDSKD